MANYATLKAAIQQVVKTNGNNEITGALLQQSLLAMINSLGGYYQFAGIATPSTNPGTPDQNVFYVASESGTYSNFSGIVVAENEVAILKWNGTWAKETTGTATAAQLNQLGQEIVKIEQNIEFTLGSFEIGTINYLNGNEISDTKGIRTGFIPVQNDLSFKFHFPVAVFANAYAIKYLNGTYSGYEGFSAKQDVIKTITKDSSFNSVRFRFAKSTDWTEEQVSLCVCNGDVPGSVLEKADENEKKINTIVGYRVEYEHGAINYLSGVDIDDTKAVRSNGYIDITIPKAIILIDATSLPFPLNYHIIQYNNCNYVGYSSGFVNNIEINVIRLNKDDTFNQIRIRLSNVTQDITDAQLNAIKTIICVPDNYADVKFEEIDKRDFITPSLHEGGYIHKDDGELKLFSGWYYTDFVEVTVGNKIIYSFYGAQSASLCAYDADMNFVQALVYGAGEHTGELLISNPRIKYVRGCTNNTSYYVVRVIKPYVHAQGYTIGCKSVYLQGEEHNAIGFLDIQGRQVSTPWVKLEENFALPSNGIYVGRIGDDVVISTNGVIKKIN